MKKQTLKTAAAPNPLEGFVLIEPSKRAGRGSKIPVIAVKPVTITFNLAAFDGLDREPFVKVLVDEPGKRVAIVKASKGEPGAKPFFQHREGKQDTVRWGSKELAGRFLKIAGVDDKENRAVKFAGEKAADGVLIFNLGQTV